MDGRSEIQSLRGPVFDNSSIHHRSARPIPGKQKSPLKKKKNRNKSSIHPNGLRNLNSMPSTGDATFTSIFIRSSTRPHRPFDNSTPGEGGEKKMESIEINK